MNCIFCKIINNELPGRIVFQDTHTIVFMDITKDVDGHMVVAPKNPIPRKKGDDVDAWPNFTGAKREIEEVFEELRMDFLS